MFGQRRRFFLKIPIELISIVYDGVVLNAPVLPVWKWVVIYAFIFVFGACWGSFLNVIIYRTPIGKSVLNPMWSFCPKCESQIAFYDNIPILSYLLLGRKCRRCKESISPRYCLVEFLTGVAFCLVFQQFGFSLATLIYWLLTAALVAITFIDIDHFIIPDSISLGLLPVGLFISILAFRSELFAGYHVLSPLEAAFGLLVGWCILDIIGEYASVIMKRDAMGRGDVKLMGMVGTFLGWKLTLAAIPISAFVGILFYLPGLLSKKIGRFQEIPYGPYLAVSSFLMMLYGNTWIEWYLRILLPEQQ